VKNPVRFVLKLLYTIHGILHYVFFLLRKKKTPFRMTTGFRGLLRRAEALLAMTIL